MNQYNYIRKENRKNCPNYVYKSGGEYTYMDKVYSEVFEKVGPYIPNFLHPNMITVIGFLMQVSSSLIFMYYDQTLQEDKPLWVYFYATFALLFYQIMDTLDGVQYRRFKVHDGLT